MVHISPPSPIYLLCFYEHENSKTEPKINLVQGLAEESNVLLSSSDWGVGLCDLSQTYVSTACIIGTAENILPISYLRCELNRLLDISNAEQNVLMFSELLQVIDWGVKNSEWLSQATWYNSMWCGFVFWHG